MLTPIEEQTLSLYDAGLTLREVGAQVGRSHEWVRKIIAKHSVSRPRGRIVVPPEPGKYPDRCTFCGRGVDDGREFCSRMCFGAQRRKNAIETLQPALEAVKAGKSFQEAAELIGVPSGWTLWSRLNHFGLLPKGSSY